MADVIIDASINTALHTRWNRAVVSPEPGIVYVFYMESGRQFRYYKSIDGGATWAGPTEIDTAATTFSVRFDRDTDGDAGTIIHICVVVSDLDDCLYYGLDTSDDSIAGPTTIFNGSDASETNNWDERNVDIVKTRGGDIACVGWINPGGENFCAISDDGGLTWDAKTSVADGNPVDWIQLVPGNETDPDDFLCFYYDRDADELTFKTFDATANTWTESVVLLAGITYNSGFRNFSSASRHSDGASLIAIWNQYDNGAADLKFIEVVGVFGAYVITTETDVLTNTGEAVDTALTINQQNDDLYVSYLHGSSWASLVEVKYKLSQDDATSWGGVVVFNEDGEDDLRSTRAPSSIDALGGTLIYCWDNDDNNDLMTNANNGIAIPAEVADQAVGSLTAKLIAAGVL